MEKWQCEILRRHQSYICNDLEPKDILSKFSSKVLPNKVVEKINTPSTRQERCDKLFEILPTRGPTAFKEFVKALKQEAPHLALVLIEAEKEHQEQKVRSLERENEELKEKVTKQASNYEKKKKKKNKKNKNKKTITTEEVKNYSEQSEAKTKAKTDLQAQVDELKNQLETQEMQMREAHRLEEEVSRLKLRSMETIRLGRIHNYSGKDFDKRGVVYALKSKFVGAYSSRTRITATRSSDRYGDPKIILENQLPRGVVSATKAKKNSWWRVDLTDNYALYLTHYTLRHGQEQRGSFLCNWRLEGSIDGREWTMLKNHKNDHRLEKLNSHSTYCTCTWPIDGELQVNAFRYFRIFQTGVHSSWESGIYLSGIELYGVLLEIGS